MKLKDLLKDLKNDEGLSLLQMRRAEDFKKQVERMIAQARKKDGVIVPCSSKKDLESCFTNHGNELFFWYNDKTGTTKMMQKKIKD